MRRWSLSNCCGACLTMGFATAYTMAISEVERTRSTEMMAIREMTALVLPGAMAIGDAAWYQLTA